MGSSPPGQPHPQSPFILPLPLPLPLPSPAVLHSLPNAHLKPPTPSSSKDSILRFFPWIEQTATPPAAPVLHSKPNLHLNPPAPSSSKDCMLRLFPWTEQSAFPRSAKPSA